MKITHCLPLIDREKCTLCGDCVQQCPQHVLALLEGRLVFTRPQDCTFCTACEAACPHGAVRCEFSIQWAQ